MALAVGFNLAGTFAGLSLSSSHHLTGNRLLLPFRLSNGGGAAFPSLASPPPSRPLTIQMAHKKGAGSTKNGRDSKGKRLGVKIYGDQAAQAGAIIIRQRGTKVHPGKNVGLGKDHTIFSLIDGVVKFEKFGPDRKKVSVYPRVEQPVNPNSYRARKIESFRLQRERKKQRREGIVVPQLVLAAAEVSAVNPVC